MDPTAADLRLLLVAGGGGSDPGHWHHEWAAIDDRCEWVTQADWTGGTRHDWVTALDRQIHAAESPVVLLAHSMGTVVVAHWAATHSGPVAGALLVAPADVDDAWVPPGTIYEQFRPIPMQHLGFPSVMPVSDNDPYLSISRARELSQAWGSQLERVGELGHIGSDADIGSWSQGREILDRFIATSILI